MKKTVLLISIGITLFFMSCQKPGRICQVSNPLTELPWLKERIGVNNIEVSKVILKDKKKKRRIEGFAIVVNKQHSFYVVGYYNCSGEVLCSNGGVAGFQCNDYEILKEEVIYETD